MSDSQAKPIAVIYSIGTAKCGFTGKKADGAVVSFADRSVTRQHLSWAVIRRLLQFRQPGEESNGVGVQPNNANDK